MVWFQCEDCGENLKKPKLLNHFRICSANNFSCIDCGTIFQQQNVLGHTQCITEAEKYGPKGQGKGFETSSTKPKNDAKQKQKPDVDINIGLSERPPWFCSICKTLATSRQTLLLHAEGKKHRAKARAHAAKQHPKLNEVPSADTNIANGAAEKDEYPSNQDGELKDRNRLEVADVQKNSEETNGNKPKKNKKRNAENPLGGSDNGEVALNGKAVSDETEVQAKKGRYSEPGESMVVESCKEEKKKIRWKELTASALKSNPDGKLKMKKLRKVLLKTLKDSGVNEDSSQFGELLEKKIISSSRFAIVGKYVHLRPRE